MQQLIAILSHQEANGKDEAPMLDLTDSESEDIGLLIVQNDNHENFYQAQNEKQRRVITIATPDQANFRARGLSRD